MKEVFTFLVHNAGGALVRVVAGAVFFFFLGVAAAALAVVLANKRKFLADTVWPRRIVLALWIVGIPALLTVDGVFKGLGWAAAHVIEENHLTEKVAGAAVHGAVDVVFQDPAARALLDDGRFPIDKTEELFELLPKALGDQACAKIEAAVEAKAGDGFISFVSVRFARLGVAVVVASSSVARKAWATPVFAALKAEDDGDAQASLFELGNAIVRVHGEPRVGHLVDDLIGSQGLPFALGALVLLLLPILGERLWRWRQKKASAAAATAPASTP